MSAELPGVSKPGVMSWNSSPGGSAATLNSGMTWSLERTLVCWLPALVEEKLRYWVAAASGEVSGMGFARLDPESGVVIEDLVILPQVCNPAGTDLDEDALLKLAFEATREQREDRLRVWWH